ncbi:MAG: hypothetical protein RR620_11220 [Clostridium sp.]
MKKIIKNKVILLFIFLITLSFVSCQKDYFNDNLKLSKDLDLYSYSFAYNGKVIDNIDKLVTYENLGFEFVKNDINGDPADFDAMLPSGEYASLWGKETRTDKKESYLFVEIANLTIEPKTYRDCTVVDTVINENSSIVFPKELYVGMEKQSLINILGEPNIIRENDKVDEYIYYQNPLIDKLNNNNCYAASGNAYSVNVSKETNSVVSINIEQAVRPVDDYIDYAKVITTNSIGNINFSTRFKLQNDYRASKDKNSIRVIINVDNIDYIVAINTNFVVKTKAELQRDLNYEFLFEQVCDPVDLIEFKPEWMAYDENTKMGYSFGFRDKIHNNKYRFEVNIVNNDILLTSPVAYMEPVDCDNTISENAKNELKKIIKDFVSNSKFQVVK